MKKRLTVTIGIAAFNEEANVRNMLLSVLKQKESGIRIKEIIVNSDGSTDQTVAIARKIKDKRIRVIDNKTRKGQAARLGEIFHVFTSHVLVIMDADTVLGDPNAIENIVKPIKKDSRVGVVAGNTIPLPGQTMLEHAINNYIYARQSLQKEYNFGKKALVAHAYLAYPRWFAKQCPVRSDILNFDAYSYFIVRRLGFRFSYAHDSISYYRSASRIREYVNQTTRHIAGGIQLGELFGWKAINKGFSVPYSIRYKIMLYQVKKNLLGYMLLKLLFHYSFLKAKLSATKLNPRWEYVKSTKGMISL